MRVRRAEQLHVQRRFRGHRVRSARPAGRGVGGEPGPARDDVRSGRGGRAVANGGNHGHVRTIDTSRTRDSVDDRAVAGAPADVALQRAGEAGPLLLGERGCRHDHPRCAEAALEALRADERLLERVLPAQALDGRHLGVAAGRARRRVDAAVHGYAVHVHGAGAAVAGVAALLHAEPAVLPQERPQALAGPRPPGGGRSVDVHPASSATTSATPRRVIASRQTASPYTSSR